MLIAIQEFDMYYDHLHHEDGRSFFLPVYLSFFFVVNFSRCLLKYDHRLLREITSS